MTLAGSIVSTRRVKPVKSIRITVAESKKRGRTRLSCLELGGDGWRQDVEEQLLGFGLLGNGAVAHAFQFTQHLVAHEQLPAQFEVDHRLS